ncbi:MAG: AAA family ATPase [Muribaculaceae bacterium]|nr:AAA family ATPase [Muribaculaceae bacterium]MDE6753487.1 AAA family ATPase [Muribaculaceae bacterium]
MKPIKRILQKEIEKRMKPQKVMLIYGARRVGKTVLLKELIKQQPGKVLLLNGESSDTLNLLREKNITNYRQLFSGVDVLAIDEAQHIPEIGSILKLIVDEVEGIKVIASGSSTFDLQNKAGEPLVGRSSQFMLTPLSIEEVSKNETGYETIIKNEERVLYGLYPELIGIENNQEKIEYLKDIVDAYLLRDILMYDGLKHSQKLFDLLRLLAWQVGSEVSLDELSRSLSLSRNTVERYLDLLQKVFVVFRIGGYSKNLRKEVSKSSKWYFQDTGIRNAILRDFRPFQLRSEAEKGMLWENFIVSERIKRALNHRLPIDHYFWRTYDQQEIDLIEVEGEKLSAFEIKAGKNNPKPPKAFSETYPDASFSVINKDTFLQYLL